MLGSAGCVNNAGATAERGRIGGTKCRTDGYGTSIKPVFSTIFQRDMFMTIILSAISTIIHFGTISGAAAANVFATGTFSIPLMKRIGYRPQFAGAVEAAASTGGQLMPPIMGAAAFLMAQITQIAEMAQITLV